MIPKYPFTVTIQHYSSRLPIVKHFETLASAEAMVRENKGKQDVRRITTQVTLDITDR